MTNAQGKAVLQHIRKIKPFLQASLTITYKRCGNPRCRCATHGPIHEVALLTWKENSKTRTLYVPTKYREEVAKWVEEGKRLKQLMFQMSQAQREFLISKKSRKR
jgi:hypothetical protein